MNLTTLIFMIFCIIVLSIYFLVPKKIQWIVLLSSSIFFLFYKNFSIFTLFQALIVLVVSYFFGLLIESSKDIKRKNILTIIGSILILSILVYLKYSNLFLITFNHIFNFLNIDYKFNLVTRNSLIGISYYSLIMIGYLIDIKRGTCKAQRNIFKCALFMSYFPILTSGPFVRYNEISEDLYSYHKFNYDRVCRGLIRVFWGLFKVLVISDRIGIFVNLYYGNLNLYRGLYMILAALLFPLELYTNFSGSIDIVLGISEILGIKLPENFKQPFFSKTLTEFWRRWHITLGAWLRDYIFYPILKSDAIQKLNQNARKKFGKKFGKKLSLYISMFIMWIAIGVWHGGAYTFIIGSGILQFVIMFFEDILEPINEKLTDKLGIRRDVFSYKLYQVIRTYLLFSFTMIFFRATSIHEAIHIIKNIFVFNPSELMNISLLVSLRSQLLDYLLLIPTITIMFIVELLARKVDVREKLFEQNLLFRWMLIFGLIFMVIIFGCYGVDYNPTEFIYGGF